MKRCLDLYCCAGGASTGLAQAGFEIVGSDIAPQPHYPFAFTQRDALSFERHELRAFDFIWASPPCQRHSSATRQTGNPDDHPDLIPPTRKMLRASGVPFVIENVLAAPLDPERTVMLCGAMFDLGVVRHRLFEFSWLVEQPPHPKHKGSLVTGEYVTVAGNGGGPGVDTQGAREARPTPASRRRIQPRELVARDGDRLDGATRARRSDTAGICAMGRQASHGAYLRNEPPRRSVSLGKS